MDKADGSGTMLFDLAARDWSAEVLAALGIDHAWMPPTHEGPGVTGAVTAAAAAATGLTAGTPVVAGGGDQAANAVGVGAVEPGVVALSLGTSGVVFATTARPLFEARGRVHAFCHAVPGRWHMMSVMLSAAGSLRWFRDSVAAGIYLRRARRRRRGGRGRKRWAPLPPLPHRRAVTTPRPARPRGVRRADPGPRSAPSHARRARGRGLRVARRPRSHGRGRHARAEHHPGLRRRHRQPGLAADPGRRPRRRDRHREHDGGSGLRGRSPGGGRRRLVPERRGRRCRRRARDARRGSRAGRPRYADVHAIYRELYPALAPSFRRM